MSCNAVAGRPDVDGSAVNAPATPSKAKLNAEKIFIAHGTTGRLNQLSSWFLYILGAEARGERDDVLMVDVLSASY